MASSLTPYLQALSEADLAALLERRIDSRKLLGQRRQDLAALGELLSSPQSIVWAAAGLDLFLAQLLRLAIWLGPEVSAGALAEQVSGVSRQELRAAASELGRWGLAFVDQSAPAGDWVLHVPAATMETVKPPDGFGSSARRLLEPKSMEFLTVVARHIGLESKPRSGKPALIAETAAALGERARVDRLLEAAPPNARDLFERVRRAGGTLSRHDLMLAGTIRWSDPPWSERRKVFTPLDWLEAHALTVVDAAAGYTGSVTVPGEVELALSGGTLFAVWPPPAPPPFVLPKFSQDPADVGDPAKVVAEMEAVLETWAQTRPPMLQKGGLGIRELRKTAKALNFPERYVSFLYALAAQAELIAIDFKGRVVPSPRRAEWAASPAPQRWATLFEAWLYCVLWVEESEDSLLPVHDAVARIWTIELRRSILQLLSELAPGELADPVQLVERLAYRHPSMLGPTDNVAPLLLRAVEGLAWLGTMPGTSLRLLEPGRSAIADPAWYNRDGPWQAAFPQEVATCTVGADLRIIVPGPPVPELATALGRFATLKASSPARIYELDEASLRRGLDAGMTAAAMAEVLAKHAPRGVPQNVAYLIEDIGRRYGNLIAGQAGLYLRSDDPALLRSAIADRRLASFHPRLIAPTVAILQGTTTEPLLAQLRLAGYLPVAEDAGGLIRGRAPDPEDTLPLLPPMPKVRPLFRAEATALARALKDGSRAGATTAAATGEGPPNGKLAAPGPEAALDRHRRKGISEIRAVIAEAIRANSLIEISYLSKNGRRSERTISPEVLDATQVEAWCLETDAEQRFTLSRIEWARHTGWTMDSLDALIDRVHHGESLASILGTEEADLDLR